MCPYVAHLPARPYATNYDTQNQIWATSKGANGSMAHKHIAPTCCASLRSGFGYRLRRKSSKRKHGSTATRENIGRW